MDVLKIKPYCRCMRWPYYLKKNYSESFSNWKILLNEEKLPFKNLEICARIFVTGLIQVGKHLCISFLLPSHIKLWDIIIQRYLSCSQITLQYSGHVGGQFLNFLKLWETVMIHLLCPLPSFEKKEILSAIYEKHYSETFPYSHNLHYGN